jgi:hypothetical protein
VDPATAKAVYDAGSRRLRVTVEVDERDMNAVFDVGSRQWQLAEAIGGTEADRNKVKEKSDATAKGGGGEGGDQEDKFHLNLPKGYNEHSGLYQEGDADEDANDTGELPEDRFHQQDIISQHLLQQREDDRKKKADKSEAERKERKEKKDDDGVEYLDVDDFKPGGKYFNAPIGTAEDEPDNPDVRLQGTKTGREAAKVMQEGLEGQEKKGKAVLESTLWTEILD